MSARVKWDRTYCTRELIAPVRLQIAILLAEGRVCIEAAHEHHVISFHDDHRGEEEAPANSLGIELEALPEGHVMLLGGSGLGIGHPLYVSGLVEAIMMLYSESGQLNVNSAGIFDLIFGGHGGWRTYSCVWGCEG
jgi:hypothetical protein